jgi:hypothetical protein
LPTITFVGLLKGNEVGERIPALFTTIEDEEGSPFMKEHTGIALSACFAFILGLGATLAEPALNQLGRSTEEQTGGKFRKWFVRRSGFSTWWHHPFAVSILM